MRTFGSEIELERTETGVKVSLGEKSVELSAFNAKWLSRNLPVILKCASGEKIAGTFKKA